MNIIRVSTEPILVLSIIVLYFALLKVFGVSFVFNSLCAELFSVGLNHQLFFYIIQFHSCFLVFRHLYIVKTLPPKITTTSLTVVMNGHFNTAAYGD